MVDVSECNGMQRNSADQASRTFSLVLLVSLSNRPNEPCEISFGWKTYLLVLTLLLQIRKQPTHRQQPKLVDWESRLMPSIWRNVTHSMCLFDVPHQNHHDCEIHNLNHKSLIKAISKMRWSVRWSESVHKGASEQVNNTSELMKSSLDKRVQRVCWHFVTQVLIGYARNDFSLLWMRSSEWEALRSSESVRSSMIF